MYIFKLVSHVFLAALTFLVGSAMSFGYKAITSQPTGNTSNSTATVEPSMPSVPLSGIYFVAPSSQGSSYNALNCNEDNGRLRISGASSDLTYQIPRIKRSMRDGRWFFFTTDETNGTHYEFFGILPELLNSDFINIQGKVVRISDGTITANHDATYTIAKCRFQ